MKIQRTITLVIPDSSDVVALAREYNQYQRRISETAFNSGSPLSALELHHAVYHSETSNMPSQLRCSAIRNVAGAYSAVKRNRHVIKAPFTFKRVSALFLYGKDFSFTRDGRISISSSIGRQKLNFRVPEYAKKDFESAVSYDSIIVTGTGRFTLCITLDVPDPVGTTPVGIDLGATNALVASTATDTLFVSGLPIKIANKKTRKTVQRLQKKLADQKAQHKDTRSVRRVLKRLGRKQYNRNLTFCRETAAKLCGWAPKYAVLVFEDLRIKQVRKERRNRSGTNRKLSQWFFNMMTTACTNKAERLGIQVAYVNPAYTSQRCRKCGLLGKRDRHTFTCICGHVEHADINASHNIRQSFTVLRSSGLQSTSPETLGCPKGKPSASC